MRAGHYRIVRKCRVVKKNGLAGYVVQQNPRGDHDEIRFAEGKQPLIVEQAQGKTRRRLGDRQYLAHAGFDCKCRSVVLEHQVPERIVQQKRIYDKLPVRHKRRIRQ